MENAYIEMNENKENSTKKRMKLNIVSNNENETISSKRKGEMLAFLTFFRTFANEITNN